MKRGNFFTVLLGAGAGSPVIHENLPRHGFVLEMNGILDKSDWSPLAWSLSPWGETLSHWKAQMEADSRNYRLLIGSGEWIESLGCWSGSARDTLAKFAHIPGDRIDLCSPPPWLKSSVGDQLEKRRFAHV